MRHFRPIIKIGDPLHLNFGEKLSRNIFNLQEDLLGMIFPRIDASRAISVDFITLSVMSCRGLSCYFRLVI